MIVLTSKLGRFEFDDTVLINQAKLVRDTVVGQWFNHRPGTPILRNLRDVGAFMLSHNSRILSGIPFDLFIDDKIKVVDDGKPTVVVKGENWLLQSLEGESRPAWLDT